MFYEKSWREIKEYLKNPDVYDYDLIVTVTKDRISKQTLDDIRSYKTNADIQICENCGFDLLPFVLALKKVNIDNYDVIYKLQSKSTKRKFIFIYKQIFLRRDWFVNLFEGVLSAKVVHKTIDLLYNDDTIGLVAAKNLICHDPKHKWQMVEEIAQKLNLEIIPGGGYIFVAGTCFAVKAKCLKQIQEMDTPKSYFESVPSTRGLSTAHFLERYICATVENQGYKYYGNDVCKFKRFLKDL